MKRNLRKRGDAETFSMPGQELYVIELDPAAIAEAKQLIQEVFATSTENASVSVQGDIRS